MNPRGKSVASPTVNHELGLLRTMLNLADADEFLNRVPQFRLFPESPRDRITTPQEFGRVLDYLSPQAKDAVIFLSETEMREREVVATTFPRNPAVSFSLINY